MAPLLVAGLAVAGVALIASWVSKEERTPAPYRAGETADEVWNKMLLQHGSAPEGTKIVATNETWTPTSPGAVSSPPSEALARLSIPPALQKDFSEAMASKTGEKAAILLDKIDPSSQAARLLIRKVATSPSA